MVFLIENGKIVLVRESMVLVYYVKLFRTGAERRNSILMSLLLLVAEAIKNNHVLQALKPLSRRL